MKYNVGDLIVVKHAVGIIIKKYANHVELNLYPEEEHPRSKPWLLNLIEKEIDNKVIKAGWIHMPAKKC